MRNAPVWNAKNPQVPVDKDGNWLHYPDYWLFKEGGWITVQPFHATLRIDSMRSGRSAKYIILANTETGVTYPMFISDLVKFMETGDVVKGLMKGTWTASKRGSNYGIKAVSE